MQTFVQSNNINFNMTKYEHRGVRARSKSYAKTTGESPREQRRSLEKPYL